MTVVSVRVVDHFNVILLLHYSIFHVLVMLVSEDTASHLESNLHNKTHQTSVNIVHIPHVPVKSEYMFVSIDVVIGACDCMVQGWEQHVLGLVGGSYSSL